MKAENKLIGLGFLTAISASLCCITPVLALLAGTSGLVATFSWIDPLRPYLIGLNALLLGIAWFQKLKPQRQIDCNCDTTEKIPFIQTKKFLAIVTVFAGLMLAFPLYSHVFFPKAENQTVITDRTNIQKAEFTINGMTCPSCEEHVNHEVYKLNGIVKTIVSYENGNAVIEFDQTQTSLNQIEEAIIKTGYSIAAKKEIK